MGQLHSVVTLPEILAVVGTKCKLLQHDLFISQGLAPSQQPVTPVRGHVIRIVLHKLYGTLPGFNLQYPEPTDKAATRRFT